VHTAQDEPSKKRNSGGKGARVIECKTSREYRGKGGEEAYESRFGPRINTIINGGGEGMEQFPRCRAGGMKNCC